MVNKFIMDIFLGKPSKSVQQNIINKYSNWVWAESDTTKDHCPELIEILNKPDSPKLYFNIVPSLDNWNGIWGIDRIKNVPNYNGWRFEMQLKFGNGNEDSLTVTFEGRKSGSSIPSILPVLVATRVKNS